MRSIQIRTNICNTTRCRDKQFFTKIADECLTLLLVRSPHHHNRVLRTFYATSKIPTLIVVCKLEFAYFCCSHSCYFTARSFLMIVSLTVVLPSFFSKVATANSPLRLSVTRCITFGSVWYRPVVLEEEDAKNRFL